MTHETRSPEPELILLSDLRTIMKEGGVDMCGCTFSKGDIIRRRFWKEGVATVPMWRARLLCNAFGLQLGSGAKT